MLKNANWIWLPKTQYPELENTAVSVFDPAIKSVKFAVVQFKKTIKCSNCIEKINVYICADVRFQLYIDGMLIGMGPVCSGGDYGNSIPMPVRYYNTYEVLCSKDSAEIEVFVQNVPTVQSDMSQGTPGLIASVEWTDSFGNLFCTKTDNSWLARLDRRKTSAGVTNNTLLPDDWMQAEVCENNCELQPAPIPMLELEKCPPGDFKPLTVLPGQKVQKQLEWDKVYSLHYAIDVQGESDYVIEISDFERYPQKAEVCQKIIASGNFRGLNQEMRSASGVVITVDNTGKQPVIIKNFTALYVHYPITVEGNFSCSDERLNTIYQMGKHTLAICRQTIELDSPMHQENLGCTGDYYIATLMNAVTYGDMRLSEFDLVRTARYLEMTDGYLFHTTYGMLWIQMLFVCYKYSGNLELLRICRPALDKLLNRFAGFVGERHIIDRPPNYMFLDWLTADGYELHHPPMALGQSALNAFYYGGLQTAEKIYAVLGIKESAKQCKDRAVLLKTAFNQMLFDPEKGLYFDGLNEQYIPNEWCPENSNKRYFSLHTNALAVLYGLAPQEKAVSILKTALESDSLPTPQPYFMHFVLEAADRVGLFGTYGMKLLEHWYCILSFKKGLQEGWQSGCGSYEFDYSHVWGGTPTYQLPQKILGLKIIKPGFEKISFKPDLFGLEFANISVPTPFGTIKAIISQKDGMRLYLPQEIEVDEPVTFMGQNIEIIYE